MDKNRIIGAGKQITGTIKETVAKLSGNAALELEGRAEVALGQGQVALGTLSDKTKDAAADVSKKIEAAAPALKARHDAHKS